MTHTDYVRSVKHNYQKVGGDFFKLWREARDSGFKELTPNLSDQDIRNFIRVFPGLSRHMRVKEAR